MAAADAPRRDDARYALVLWPDTPNPLYNDGDEASPSCIETTADGQDCVAVALARGAVVVAVERSDWCTHTPSPIPSQRAATRTIRARRRKNWWLYREERANGKGET